MHSFASHASTTFLPFIRMHNCLPRSHPAPPRPVPSRPARARPPASKKGSLFPEHSTGALQCRAVAFAPDGSFMLTASHHTIRLTTNMHHARTLCRFAAWHHHELTAALRHVSDEGTIA